MTESDCNVLLIAGDEIARYGFGDGHPFGPDRHEAFMRELHQCGLDGRVQRGSARTASREELEWFHTPAYVDLVRRHLDAARGEARRATRSDWLFVGLVMAALVALLAASAVLFVAISAWLLRQAAGLF